jgi:hypothetical protein
MVGSVTYRKNIEPRPMNSLSDVIELTDCRVSVPRRTIHHMSTDEDRTEITLWDGTVIVTKERLNILGELFD